MKIRLGVNKSVHENAAAYYVESKEAKEKMKGVEKAIEETKKEMVKAGKDAAAADKKSAEQTKIARKREWHEKFHYFFTSSGKLVIGGRNAEQNDLIYNKYFEEGDLFFHADIQGASACILKNESFLEGGLRNSYDLILKNSAGTKENELKEVAQFAACYSNAWKNGNAAVDVYAVGKGQVAKHAQGGFIPRGGFAILGERIWFRKTELKLKIGLNDGIAVVLPGCSVRKLEKELLLVPGSEEKGVVVKKLAKLLTVHPDDLQNLLPAGLGKILKT